MANVQNTSVSENKNILSSQLNQAEIEKKEDTIPYNDVCIFNKYNQNTDKTLNNDDIQLNVKKIIKAMGDEQGVIGKALNKVKQYVIDYFEQNKLNSEIDKKGYFPYTKWEEEPKAVQSLDEIPTGSHDKIKDARNCDISKLNLSEDELLNLCIDKTTIMSPEQKAILEPYKEAAKNPGLGIRELHEQGITGKGVNMAIIDQPLGIHKEYAGNIKGNIHDINSKEMGWDASMHGAAVASIAVGKSTGVAPDADLTYYSAVNFSTNPDDIQFYKNNIHQKIESCKEKLNQGNVNNKKGIESEIKELQSQLANIEKSGRCQTNKPYVDAINKILDENEKLPENERVPVISISWGFNKLAPGYEELQQSIQRAKDQGVFIVSTSLEEHYGMSTCGANRNPKGNLENATAYESGAFWKKWSEDKDIPQEVKDKLLLVPMDHRTVADFTDGTSYRYEGNDGGMSWSTPWLAGMYVLSKQADTNITPEKFWQYALETSDECRNNDSGNYVGRIINPQKLIQKIQENKIN